MNITEIISYPADMQSLIQKQQRELDKTRNLLARAILANDGKIDAPAVPYSPEDYLQFGYKDGKIIMETLPTPF